MGRLGLAGDGIGANRSEPRLHCLMAAIRGAGGVLPGQFGGASLQLAFRLRVPGLGLVHSIPDQHRHGRRRAVDPGHSRNPGLPKSARRGTRRVRAGASGAQAPAQRGGTDGLAAAAGAGAGIHLRRVRLHLRHNGIGPITQFYADWRARSGRACSGSCGLQ